MSLKTIHIFLILTCIVSTLAFGAYEIHRFQLMNERQDLILGSVSSVSGLALLVYGVYFLRKTKHISYL
ncbi:MAG: hypothetical protein ACPGVU_09455 [Limisphaerales bacterium]